MGRIGYIWAATRGAECHSAVSQVGNLCGESPTEDGPTGVMRPAECHSAIQQISNLRYQVVSSIQIIHHKILPDH
jgi:hypothetical protein